MAEAHGGSREQESIDLQLKSLVSQINTSTDDFDMDVAEAPTLPIPSAAKNMSSSDVAVSSLLSFSQSAATDQAVTTNLYCNDTALQEGSVGLIDNSPSHFGILPSRPPSQVQNVKMSQSNGLPTDSEPQQRSEMNAGHANGFSKSDPQSVDSTRFTPPSNLNPTLQGTDQSTDQAANSLFVKSEPALHTEFPGEQGDNLNIKKESPDTLSKVEFKPMEESEIERRNIAVAGFAALNGQDSLLRKSIRQPKKKMIQDYVEYSNSLGMEEEGNNNGEAPEKEDTEDQNQPNKKKGKKGRKSGKGKKAAKEKLDVDEVYKSDEEEEKKEEEGQSLEEDLNRDVIKVRMMKCNKCDKHFLDKSKLRMHQRAAHKPNRVLNEDTDYHCSECGKIFKRREHWRRHKEVHEVSRPHICITCGKAFKRLEHVKRHQSVHFTDKPFPCDECGKAFTRRDHLAKHKLLHESGGLIRPFAHKRSRRSKKIESEELVSSETSGVKGSRKRKITVQLKARKVESPTKEEDYLDDKEAQSSDFLSSDEEPLVPPKKKAKSSKTKNKNDQENIDAVEIQQNLDTDEKQDLIKTEGEFESVKSENDEEKEEEMQDKTGNATSSTENEEENVNAEDGQQSVNVDQEQQKLNEDDSENVCMGSNIQIVNTEDNSRTVCMISSQENDSGLENMNLENTDDNVIPTETGQNVNIQDYQPNENTVAIDINLSFKE